MTVQPSLDLLMLLLQARGQDGEPGLVDGRVLGVVVIVVLLPLVGRVDVLDAASLSPAVAGEVDAEGVVDKVGIVDGVVGAAGDGGRLEEALPLQGLEGSGQWGPVRRVGLVRVGIQGRVVYVGRSVHGVSGIFRLLKEEKIEVLLICFSAEFAEFHKFLISQILCGILFNFEIRI